jgi:tRNA (guanine26-N2/guanine27-N2)-dimethyltransferase
MLVNRDLSTAMLARWPHPLRSVLDGLAATGAWGIRMALETPVQELTFNDRSRSATDLIVANVARNAVEAKVVNEDLVRHLRHEHYDFVDIDPFGPPTPFLDAAFESAPVPSGLGITATDTAVLCGTYPEACLRRYGARSLRCPQGNEVGVRILLAYCDRIAEAHGKAIRPVLSFAAEHFLRVLLVVDRRTARSKVQTVAPQGLGRFALATSRTRGIGPLWAGSLHDSSAVRTLNPSSWTTVGAARLVSTIQREEDLPPFFVTTDELASHAGGSPPRIERFIEGLRAMGYRAARTHFHPRGVKTDAPEADVLRVYSERMPTAAKGDSKPAN